MPTPDNLRRWNQAKDIQCGLCGQLNVTLKLIEAGCGWVRNVENKLRLSKDTSLRREDRYTWRHNCCLLVVARAILLKLQKVNAAPVEPVADKPQTQTFVKPGTVAKRSKKQRRSILSAARDWKCNFDLPEYCSDQYSQLQFPQDVCATNLRIDGYIISREKKICVLGPEITAPMDDNVQKWHGIKKSKYRNAVQPVQGWTFHDLDLEVGALGWVPPSTHTQLKTLGFSRNEVSQIVNDLRYVARKCSYVIFVNRFNPIFKPWRITASSDIFDSDDMTSSLIDTGPLILQTPISFDKRKKRSLSTLEKRLLPTIDKYVPSLTRIPEEQSLRETMDLLSSFLPLSVSDSDCKRQSHVKDICSNSAQLTNTPVSDPVPSDCKRQSPVKDICSNSTQPTNSPVSVSESILRSSPVRNTDNISNFEESFKDELEIDDEFDFDF